LIICVHLPARALQWQAGLCPKKEIPILLNYYKSYRDLEIYQFRIQVEMRKAFDKERGAGIMESYFMVGGIRPEGLHEDIDVEKVHCMSMTSSKSLGLWDNPIL